MMRWWWWFARTIIVLKLKLVTKAWWGLRLFARTHPAQIFHPDTCNFSRQLFLSTNKKQKIFSDWILWYKARFFVSPILCEFWTQLTFIWFPCKLCVVVKMFVWLFFLCLHFQIVYCLCIGFCAILHVPVPCVCSSIGSGLKINQNKFSSTPPSRHSFKYVSERKEIEK